MLGRFLGSLLLVAVPSLISGCGDRELVELGALLQRGIGWSSPVPYPVLGALRVVALFAVVRIVALLSTLGLRAVGLVLVGAAFLLALVLPTLWMLGTYPAPAGAERVEKIAAVGVLATLLGAMVLARRRVSGRGNRVVLGLAIGWIATGLVAAGAGSTTSRRRPPISSTCARRSSTTAGRSYSASSATGRTSTASSPSHRARTGCASSPSLTAIRKIHLGRPLRPWLPASRTSIDATSPDFGPIVGKVSAWRQTGPRSESARRSRVSSTSGPGFASQFRAALPSRRTFATPCRPTTTVNG